MYSSPRRTFTTFRRATFTLLFLACLPVLAQGERLPLKIYTVADGLASNEINKIVTDSRGFLWFCTSDGLSRFDGYAFTNYGTDQGLPNSNITDLLETRGGEYWVATYGGLVRFNPKGIPANLTSIGDTNTIAPMFTVIIPEDDDRLSRAINALVEDRNGTIWCATQNGLFRLSTNDNQRRLQSVDIGIPYDYMEQRFIADLLEDRYGSMWIATPAGLYRRWPNGKAARYTKREGLPNEYLGDLLKDHDGNLWVGTRMAGFFRLITDDTEAPPRVALAYSSQNGLSTNWVAQLFETVDRRFWLATNAGLVEFFPRGDKQGRFRTYNKRNGLSYHGITTLNEDISGNLWLGTNTTGAMKLARNGFVTYDEQDAVVMVNDIFADRTGSVCFKGNVRGDQRALDPLKLLPQSFGCFDGQRFTWFVPNAISNLGWVMEDVTLQSRNGEWWVGGGEGLFRFPPSDSLTRIKTARPLAAYTIKDGVGPTIFRLFEDSHDNVWIAGIGPTTNQLIRWERANEAMRDLGNSPGLPFLKDDLPRSFGEDQAGNVWIGFNSGLARHADDSFRFFTSSDGLPPGAIRKIFFDRAGRLWLASARSGLVRVDDPSGERPLFINYTTAQGLASNNLEVITDDVEGHIYVGGAKGLDRLNPTTGEVKHFTTADGLSPGLFLAAFRDRNDVLWFGMSSGLSRYVPAPDVQTIAPRVLISGLRIGGSQRLISAVGETDISLLDLEPNDNQIQLDFVALAFVPGDVLRYQYKLDGADGEWSAPNEQRSVNYANLAPGRYTFLVRTIASDGTTGTPAIVRFTIRPPLWRRGWFVLLVTLACGGLLFAIYRYRLSHLMAITNMRTRIATDLHDDIGANLTRISLLTEVTKQSLNYTNECEDSPLTSISRIARESVSSMSDIIWAIDPKRDNLLDLTRKMRQHADEVFTLRDIELQFKAPGPSESLRLGVDVRRDLLLIFKETVNNAARHSRCTKVTIDLEVHASTFLLRIADNGVGFDQLIESQGQGLRSIKRRTAALGGTLSINSNLGVETIVRVTIPISRRSKTPKGSLTGT
jgi:ligand-binding sensor domain-containing protein/two-component sensor histidine kinase